VVVDGLVKRYPGAKVNAVDGVTFAVERGEIFGLSGLTGARGRRRPCRSRQRGRAPSDGSVTLAGIDVARRPSTARLRLGMVTRMNTLDRSLNVWENLFCQCRYFGFSRAEARHRVDEPLERSGLDDRRRELVDRLSDGSPSGCSSPGRWHTDPRSCSSTRQRRSWTPKAASRYGTRASAMCSRASNRCQGARTLRSRPDGPYPL
jgi:ABC-type lipopolysaccharide export system ATPase subunit